MQITLFGYTLTVALQKITRPFELSNRARNKSARQIDKVLILGGKQVEKIERIKIARIFFRPSPDQFFGLKDAKEWVEMAYADNGNGDPL